MENKEQLAKVTLSSKKEVLLRYPKIKHQRIAAQVAGKAAGNNQAHLQVMVQEEMVKLLLHSVDGAVLSGPQREDLDSLFSIAEYNEVLKAVDKMGGDMSGEPQIGIYTSGS